MKQVSEQPQASPWYKHGTLWLIIGLLSCVVIASMITMTIAVKNKPDILPSQTDEASH